MVQIAVNEPRSTQTGDKDWSSFELPGGSPGVLLVHGFTGDPREMRPLAEMFNRLGLYCYAPLLPGHGVLPMELHSLTDEHLLDAVRAGLDHVRAQHDRVIVCSYSMGGALSAIMLEQADPHGEHVAGFIAVAPMIATRFPLLALSPVISRLVPWVYPLRLVSIDTLGMRKKILQYDPTLDLDDPQVVARLRDELRLPLTVSRELRKIARRAILAPTHLHVPTLVVQGASDLTLDPEGARRFYRGLAAHDRMMVTIFDADHRLVWPGKQGHEELLYVVEGWVRQRFLKDNPS